MPVVIDCEENNEHYDYEINGSAQKSNIIEPAINLPGRRHHLVCHYKIPILNQISIRPVLFIAAVDIGLI